MESSVREHLLQISAEFYRFHADSFDETRKSAWDSWDRVLDEVQNRIFPGRILDLGCGNGRFASFLENSLLRRADYIGIDSEEKLILKARTRHQSKTFYVQDLEHALEKSKNFDLIVCFGVFHHLPGRQYRVDILNSFANVLNTGGIAALSFWQPKLLKNFSTKIFKDHNISGLEENDFLLGWKGDFSHLRYCHHFDNDEIDELISQSKLELINDFQGTGNDSTNRYLILKNQ